MINSVTSTEKTNIKNKTPYVLPDRPTERGFTASQIKGYYYKALTDDSDSIIALINRVISDANGDIGNANMSDIEIDSGSGTPTSNLKVNGVFLKEV